MVILRKHGIKEGKFHMVVKMVDYEFYDKSWFVHDAWSGIGK